MKNNRGPRIFYCDHHEFPLPPGHKFPQRKYRLLRERLQNILQLSPAPLATPTAIALAHDAGYVRRFLDGTLDPAVLRRIGFPWSEGLVRRTLASVGGTLAATRQALRHGWGGTLAGGTHHAFYSEGSGFCVFNDIAVAVQWLRTQDMKHVTILDLDVHQGDGTAELFAGDPDVLTISVHGRNNFPFRKRRSDIDVDLPDATGDGDYLEVLDDLLPRALEHKPDILFYQSGVDSLATDRLGRLALSPEGLAERDRRVFEAARKCDVPLVLTLGGGYSEPIEATVDAHATTFLTAAHMLGLNATVS
jgi:acetoin utilization deacetylase AcuC-like enzyme